MQGKARQGKAWQGKARQGKAMPCKRRQSKARQKKARQNNARERENMYEHVVHRKFIRNYMGKPSNLHANFACKTIKKSYVFQFSFYIWRIHSF